MLDSTKPRILAALIAWAFLDCSLGRTNAEPIERVLKTAAPLAYAATLAMAALDEENGACGEIQVGCSTYPCEQNFELLLGPECSLPLGNSLFSSGRLPITATFSTPERAELIILFQDLDLNGENLIIRRGLVAVEGRGDTLSLAYGDQGVEIEDDELKVGQAAWALQIETMGTPADLSDDRFILDGAEQQIINGSILQVSMRRAEMRASCPRNPVAGSASIQSLGDSGTELSTISFHPSCDGQAELDASIGSRALSLGARIDLSLTP